MSKEDQQKRSSQQHDAAGYHVPVLLKESVEALKIRPDGIYVDCTFGGGGHSRAILAELNDKGRLIAFDQDIDAKANIPEDDRVVFIANNFRYLQRFLRLNGIETVNGILADLGVSSHQFDEASRGFSTRFEANLDMRMDQRQIKTAADVLTEYSEAELHKIFEQYGEVTNSKTLAKTIVEVRRTQPLKTIQGLKTALASIVKGNPHKYFAQVFQALRMEVNEEMKSLEEMLAQAPFVMSEGARIAVITFHSIEDRMVKNFFRDYGVQQEEDHPFESRPRKKLLEPVNKKPVTADEEELRKNPRARSAKLRVAEKV